MEDRNLLVRIPEKSDDEHQTTSQTTGTEGLNAEPSLELFELLIPNTNMVLSPDNPRSVCDLTKARSASCTL